MSFTRSVPRRFRRPLQRAVAETLEARRLLHAGFAVSVNFQPASSTLPDGYLLDSGGIYGDRGNGNQYGWNQSNSSATRDRNNSLSPDQRYDTLTHTQQYGDRTWEMAIPNGTYNVKVVAGDPSFIDGIYKFNVENVPVVNGTPTSGNRWIEGTETITITDGKLTLTNASGAKNNRLAFVDITAHDSPPTISLTSPASGTTFPAGSDVVIKANASDAEGTVALIDFYAGATKIGTERMSPFEITWADAPSGTHTITAVAFDDDGNSSRSSAITITVGASSTVPKVPGTIQAEDFDAGGEGVAYHDTTNGNAGSVYRTSDVDVVSASEGGYAVGWTRPSEWLQYTFDAPTSGSYTVEFRVASGGGGGTFHFDIDGVNKSGTMTLGNTGGWQTWKTIAKSGVNITAGRHTLRLTFDSTASGDIGNINWVRFVAEQANTWKVGAPSPIARFESNNAVVNGLLYVFGGYNKYIQGFSQSHVYDPAKDSWSALPNMKEATTHSGVAVDGTTIWMAGGFIGNGGGHATDHVWKFDTTNKTWIAGPKLPQARSAGGLVRVGRELHFFGGTNSNYKNNFGDHWVLQLDGGTSWTSAPALPNPRNHFGYAVLNNKIYVIGGQHLANERSGNIADVHVYDIATDKWSDGVDLPFARSHNHTSTFIRNGRIVIVGGQANGGNVPLTIDDVIEFDPGQNKWLNLPPLPEERQATVAQIINGEMIVTTGTPSGIDPRTTTWKMRYTAPAGAAAKSAAFSETSIAALAAPAAVVAADTFAASINFQPASAPVPAGYQKDDGAVFGDRGNGLEYGWDLVNTSPTRDRNSSLAPDQRYDTLNHMQLYGVRTWEMAVPNGTYRVRLVAGDPSNFDGLFKLNAENVLIVDGTPTSGNRWIEGTQNITVADGRLTISNAPGSQNNKISFIEVTPISSTPGPNIPGTFEAEDFDSGPAGSAYVDTTSGNAGKLYRSTDVDIIAASEGGHAIGFTRPGEWLKYTFNAQTGGNFDLDIRVASGSAGGTFHIEIDGVNKTGPMTLSNSGGWQTWKTLTKNGIAIGAGQHEMRLVFDSAASSGDIGNVNWIKLSAASNLPAVSIAATDSSASEAGGNTGTFTVTRTGATTTSLVVKYAISGVAQNGTDYNTLNGTVTIPAGAASATITVTPKSDSQSEGSESVILTLVGAPSYTISGGPATVTISDASSAAWPASFTTVASAPKARWESNSVSMNGKLYVFNGWTASKGVGTQQVDVYDVAANKWTTLAQPSPVPHTHSTFAADPAANSIYFAGGLFGGLPGTWTDRVWKFNTLTSAWTELPSMPTPREGGAMVFLNNKLHYFGGCLEDRVTNTGAHYVFDLATQQWSTAEALPDGRDHLSAVVLNGKIYAIGGEFGHDEHHIQQSLVDVFDPATGHWTRVASLPTPKSHAEASTFVHNGKIYVAGGQLAGYQVTDEVVMYDPAQNKWTTVGKIPKRMQGPVVLPVGNKLVITTGNGDFKTYTTTYVADLP